MKHLLVGRLLDVEVGLVGLLPVGDVTRRGRRLPVRVPVFESNHFPDQKFAILIFLVSSCLFIFNLFSRKRAVVVVLQSLELMPHDPEVAGSNPCQVLGFFQFMM